MAVYPNSEITAFCYWMLNVSWQQLTPSRLNLITTIYNAGVNNTTVTDTEYNNFTQVSAWRYKYYLIWLSGQTPNTSLPYGTPSFWFKMQGLYYNQINSFGTSLANNQVSQINNYVGGSINATQSTVSKQAYLINLLSGTNQAKYLSFNNSATTEYIINNALAVTNGLSGFTIYIVGETISTATNKFFLFISRGTDTTNTRIGILTDTSNNWLISYRRADADSLSTITGPSSIGGKKIIAVSVDCTNAIGKLFVNGALYSTTNPFGTTGSISATNSQAMRLGASLSANYLYGYMADCIFINTLQSDANVISNMDSLNTLHLCY